MPGQGLDYCAQQTCRPGTDVDRNQVVVERQSTAEFHLSQVGVETANLAVGIVTSDKTRQHARIGRVQIAANRDKANTSNRVHREMLQHESMAVPSAD